MGCLAATLPCCGVSQVDLIAYVHMDHRPKPSELQPGAILQGRLISTLFWGDRELFPAGSGVQLVVDRVEKRRTAAAPWGQPFVIRLLTPRHEGAPFFRGASIAPPNGQEVQVNASFVRLTRSVEVRAKGNQPGSAARKKAEKSGLVMILKLGLEGLPDDAPAADKRPVAVAAGTHARLILLQSLSASKSRRGDTFQARLAEPVRQGSQLVLPAGSVFEGLVTKRIAPRRLSRPGSLFLSFTKLTLPGGRVVPLLASSVGAEAEQGSHLKMDTEGGLHGGGPGVARMLLDVAVATGVSKVTDDATQLLIEVLISTATDVSTAGTARIVGACVSGVFLVTRHGRDVILPQYTRIEVVLNRPLSLERALR